VLQLRLGDLIGRGFFFFFFWVARRIYTLSATTIDLPLSYPSASAIRATTNPSTPGSGLAVAARNSLGSPVLLNIPHIGIAAEERTEREARLAITTTPFALAPEQGKAFVGATRVDARQVWEEYPPLGGGAGCHTPLGAIRRRADRCVT
jgi:hypothetical protein